LHPSPLELRKRLAIDWNGELAVCAVLLSCPSKAIIISLALDVEMPVTVGVLVPVLLLVLGNATFESNGDAVFAPVIPKTNTSKLRV
jgi:hypothetical protein